jgi:ParB family chromosome partitioning protein
MTTSATSHIGVKNLKTSELVPNPHNPRMLFDRAPLDTLKTSIARVGILVPLTVYRDSKKHRYVILDGQRRWLCAQELKLATVPVNQVAEPTLVQNIVTMFQIHKLRADWELMPTALKLELLMHELKERRDSSISQLTGLDQAVVARCKKLLSYPPRYQEMMLDPDPEKRIKADFFIELFPLRTDRFLNKEAWFDREDFTKKMLSRYQTRTGLKAVTDFRVVKQRINNALRAGKATAISSRMREFTENPSILLEHLEIPAANVNAAARRVAKLADQLLAAIEDIQAADYYGEEALWESLEKVAVAIRKKLLEADRRPKT